MGARQVFGDSGSSVDMPTILSAIDPKPSVRAATTAALAAHGASGGVLTKSTNGALPAIDGVTLVAADRLLVKDETTQNGIYVVTDVGAAGRPWVLTRASDANASADVTSGMSTYVSEGSTNQGTWYLTTADPIVLDTTALTFAQAAGSGGTPSAHAASHQNGGSDEVATATPGANAIPKATSGGKLDSWITTASAAAPGIAELATQAEVNTGTDTGRVVTPETLTSATTVVHPARQVIAGAALTGGGALSADITLDVGVDNSTIEVNSDALRVKALGITAAHVAAANKDGTTGTASMRTLGTGATQAAAGDDSRLTTPSGVGTTVQAWDADLDAVAALSSSGLAVKTGAGAWSVRTLQAPAAGFTVTNPAGTAGDPTFVLANDLAALEGLSSTGLAARTTTDTWAQRTLQAPAAGFTITNPAGVAGDPTFVLANDLSAIEALSSTGLATRTATDTWAQRSLASGNSYLTITNPAGVAGNPTVTANIGATANTLAAGDDSRLSDSRTPTAHATSHKAAGSDEIDGDKLDIDWVPSNYTRTVVTETSATTDLSSHLKGLDLNAGIDNVYWIDFDFAEDPANTQIQRKKMPNGWSAAEVVARASGIPTAGTIAVERDNNGTTQTLLTTANVNASTVTPATTEVTLGTINATPANLAAGATSWLRVTCALLDLPASTDALYVSVRLVRT